MDYKALAREKTEAHCNRVYELMRDVGQQIMVRGGEHDISKFSDEELGPLTKLEEDIAVNGKADFGTERYDQIKREILRPMIEHHHAHNSHHPEHYPDGVHGMCILDFLEMLCDWKAANERDGKSVVPLTFLFGRYFPLDIGLQALAVNFYKKQGWNYS